MFSNREMLPGTTAMIVACDHALATSSKSVLAWIAELVSVGVGVGGRMFVDSCNQCQ